MATDASAGISRATASVFPARRRRIPIGRRALIGVVLGWFALLILVPAAALIRQVVGGGWQPFVRALASPELQHAFVLTLGITGVATVINALFGVAFALVLVRQRFWGRSLADGLVDLPFAVSPVIASLMLIILYGPDAWLGRGLESVGIRIIYALPGMVLATMFVTLPFVVREVVPVLREFGIDQVEAAYTLGASRWQTFRRVTLPVIRWGLAYGFTLTVARAFGEFGALLVVSGNLVGRTQTATLYIHDGIESFRPEGAYAASLVLAGVSFAMLVGMDRIRERMAIREGGKR
ncbi:MAG: sulfate ABC transporter permease [Isosphaeraceae bacterium]